MNKITIDQIKEKLYKNYKTYFGEICDREVVITKAFDNYKEIGSILFSLNGSPPKGYALYIIDRHMINFYNPEGKRWKIIRQVYIPEYSELE